MITLTKITLDKAEVVRRQLETAIDLWFNDSEPVAIHTLACAAHEVLASLLKRQGKSQLMFDPKYYNPGFTGEARKALHKHYNFFKHADQDADETIEFPVGITDMFLLIAIDGWRDLIGKREPIHFAYWFWNIVHHPEIMKMHDRQTGIPMQPLSRNVVEEFMGLSKDQFKKLSMIAFCQES